MDIDKEPTGAGDKIVLRLAGSGDRKFAEGEPGKELLSSPDEIAGVIEACLNNGVRSLLLYSDNLPPGFFDLSTGEAGTILQKLRNYRIRLAVVLFGEGVSPTDMFQTMAAEESRGNDFRVFEGRGPAEQWLTAA